jgi:2-oxoglutarate ferredoxin oxidoreductase subunit alpha
VDWSIKVGGEAGQGVQTVGEVLSMVLARTGFHVFTHQDYESRVRGGHNFYQIRVSRERVMSSDGEIDVVVALDRASIELHRGELKGHGIVAYDSVGLRGAFEGPEMLDVPFRKLAVEEGGGAVMANTAAVGAVLGMLGLGLERLEEVLRDRFINKGEAVVFGNIKAARAGHRYARENCGQCRFPPGTPTGGPKVLISGVEAAAVGALASGCKFYSAYPMTPSTGVMNHIASRAARYGVIVEQAEDEIAAINMAIGASYSGVRAATGSSGGGVALMVEGISLAGMTETPLVVFCAQRPGPATGLPTRTEQADLLFVLFSGHGEFPRVVLAPGSPRQMIFLTNKAFDLAEKYQIPVFVLLDQYLADSQWTYGGLDPGGLVYNDYRLRGERLRSLKEYRRHAFTESGITPLAVPGESAHLVVTDSDEHDEEGHITEDGVTRMKMVLKRLLRKTGPIKAEMGRPMLYGEEKPETVLVGWGSTYGVLRETVDELNSSAMLFFNEIHPLPDGEYMKVLQEARHTVCVEGNATGQFASLIRMQTGFKFDRVISRYDGRPFTTDCILGRL